MLRSSELAAEAERRSKVVLESQESNFRRIFNAKQASLVAVEVESLATPKLTPPERRHCGRTASSARATRLPRHPGHLLCCTHQVGRSELSRETQLTNVKIGDAAELRIGTNIPDNSIRGKVVEIAPASGSQFALLPPDNATGNFTKVVQRIPVKIALDDPAVAARLRPGLSCSSNCPHQTVTEIYGSFDHHNRPSAVEIARAAAAAMPSEVSTRPLLGIWES